MPARRYPDWASAVIAEGGTASPVAFCPDLSPPSVLAAYRRGIVPLPAADEYFRTVNEVRYSDQVADGTIAVISGSEHEDPYWAAWWSPDPRPVIGVDGVHLGRNVRKQLRRDEVWTTADAAFGRVAQACRAEREPRWLTDDLLRSLAELHAEGWVHSIEVWQDGDLIGGAFGVAIGRVISGDSLFGRRGGAARIAVADMAERFGAAGGLLIDAQWDTPFLRSLGAEPVPRERYLPLLAGPGHPSALPSAPLPARRLLPPRSSGAGEQGGAGESPLSVQTKNLYYCSERILPALPSPAPATVVMITFRPARRPGSRTRPTNRRSS